MRRLTKTTTTFASRRMHGLVGAFLVVIGIGAVIGVMEAVRQMIIGGD